jgi:hypothetical protein
VHRLSYELHFGEIPGGLYVMHSCDNRACVNPAHLSLGTHEDNMRDMTEKGRKPLGSRSSSAKLTEDQVSEIRRRHGGGEVQRDLAREFGVGHTSIGRIVRGEGWKHVPSAAA